MSDEPPACACERDGDLVLTTCAEHESMWWRFESFARQHLDVEIEERLRRAAKSHARM